MDHQGPVGLRQKAEVVERHNALAIAAASHAQIPLTSGRSVPRGAAQQLQLLGRFRQVHGHRVAIRAAEISTIVASRFGWTL